MSLSWGILAVVSILILGSVGLEQSAAGQGSSFQQDQIAEIQEIIQDMQDDLNNLHVTWANVTEKPVGFENDTNDDSFFGIFQSSDSVVEEPCDPGDVISWSGINWECIILPSTLSVLWGDILDKPVVLGDLDCETNQIAKYEEGNWNCSVATSSNTEFNVNLGNGTVTKKEKVLYEFKIVDLPFSDEHYSIPINHMILESNLNVVEGDDLNILLQSYDSVQEKYIIEINMGTQEFGVFFKTASHASQSKNEIEIEEETTEKRFRIIAQALDNDKVTPATGNFTDLKLKLNLLLPGDAYIDEIPPPPPSPPVAVDDSATTNEDTLVTISVLSNDTDADEDTLSISSVTQGSNGAVAIVGTDVTYTPNSGFSGSDSFTYTVSDGDAGTVDDVGTVNVTVNTPSSADLAVFAVNEIVPCGLGEESAVCTFVVSVTNIGPDDATDVVIYDNLSVGAISSTSTTDGLVDELSLSELVWLIDAILAGDTVTLTITAESSPDELSITNTASVSSLVEVDPDPSNDLAEETKVFP